MRSKVVLLLFFGIVNAYAQRRHIPYVAVGGGLHTSYSFNRLDHKWLLTGGNVQMDYAPVSWFSLRVQGDFLHQPFQAKLPVSTRISQVGLSLMPLINLNIIHFDQGSLLLGPVGGVGYIWHQPSTQFDFEINDNVSPGILTQSFASQLSFALGYRHKIMKYRGLYKHQIEILSYINNWIYGTPLGYRSINFFTFQLNYRYVL
jgi:hypothetical protein